MTESNYSAKLAQQVCRLMASGLNTRDVERALNLPPVTIRSWCVDHPEFRIMYNDAFTMRAYGMVDEALDILDSVPADAGLPQIAHARNRAELRKWIASKVVPYLRDRVDISAESGIVVIQLPDNKRALLTNGAATMVESVDSDDPTT